MSVEGALDLGGSPVDTPTCSSMGLQMELSEMLQLEGAETEEIDQRHAYDIGRPRSLMLEPADLAWAFQKHPRERKEANMAWMQLGGSAI